MAVVTTRQLARFAVDQLEAGVSSDAVAKKLSAYLLDERRSRDMGAVMRAIDTELERRGSTQVVITSARPVSDDIKMKLAALLTAKNPSFDEVIDESVIGGVKARAGEQEVDLTVRGKLQRFKQQVAKA